MARAQPVFSGVTTNEQSARRQFFGGQFRADLNEEELARQGQIRNEVVAVEALAAAKARAAQLAQQSSTGRGRRIARVNRANNPQAARRPTGGIRAAQQREIEQDRIAKERKRRNRSRRTAERNKRGIDDQIRAILGSLAGGF